MRDRIPPNDLALLRHEKAESDALFLSIGEGALVTDNNANISRVYKSALDILGYKKDELLGKWYPEVVIVEDEHGVIIPNMERPIMEVFLTGKSVFRKVIYRRKDGARISLAVTVSPILLNKSPVGAIEVFRDITEEVKLENAKDEFISVASHELRTPATIVKQYLSMLVGGYAGTFSKRQLNMLRTAYESNERQLTIINDLLRVARAEAGKVNLTKESVDVVTLLARIVTEQETKYKNARQSVSYKHTVRSAYCNADPVHMRMILENILSNAHKYTPIGKKIEVTLSEGPHNIKITVKDEGVGIQKKDIPKLFQKFSRIDNPLAASAGGSGLGLFWVKKLVTLHNGSIRVSSKINEGTTFTILLPKG